MPVTVQDVRLNVFARGRTAREEPAPAPPEDPSPTTTTTTSTTTSTSTSSNTTSSSETPTETAKPPHEHHPKHDDKDGDSELVATAMRGAGMPSLHRRAMDSSEMLPQPMDIDALVSFGFPDWFGDDDDDDDDDDDGDHPKSPERKKQTMLLGRIHHLETPLYFDGGGVLANLFWGLGGGSGSAKGKEAVASLRLTRPGNLTEQGGSERWLRVLKHPFLLTVQGALQYDVPLTHRHFSSPIEGSVVVKPGNGVGGGDPDGGDGGGDGGGGGDDDDGDGDDDGGDDDREEKRTKKKNKKNEVLVDY
jgi:hypothetical protein